MILFGSLLPEPTVKKALEVPCPASRSGDDLHQIFNYVSTRTELSQNNLWHFLTTKHKYNFCRYMHYSYVHEKDGQSLEIHDAENKNANFYILIKGKSANLISRHPSNLSSRNLSLNDMHGVCLGNVYMAKSLRRLTSMIADRCKLNPGICQQFITDHNKSRCKNDKHLFFNDKIQNNVVMHLGRGSIYIVISSKECSPFIEKQIDLFMHRKIFRRLPLCLENKKINGSKYNEDGKRRDHCCNYKICRFPSGTSIYEEGVEYNEITIILRGSCVVTQNVSNVQENVTHFLDQHNIKNKEAILETLFTENEEKHNGEFPPICHVGPMSFLGFLPYFTHCNDELPIHKFDLSEKGQTAKSLVPFETTNDGGEESNMNKPTYLQPLNITVQKEVLAIVIPDAEVFVNVLTQTNSTMTTAFKELAEKQRKWLKESYPLMLGKYFGLNMEKEVEEPPFDDLPLTAEDFEKIISTMCVKPKLNRHKILKEFRRLIVGSDEDSEKEDVYASEESESDSEDDWDNEDIELYDDLQPYPSILHSRKLHGKTLPIVRRSQGYICPWQFEKNVEE